MNIALLVLRIRILSHALGQFCLGKAMGWEKTAVSHPKRQISILANAKHTHLSFDQP